MNPDINLDKVVAQITEIGLEYGPVLLGAIVVWIIGSWIIKILSNSIAKLMDKRGVEATLKPFLKTLVSSLLKVMLIISVLGMLGIEMT